MEKPTLPFLETMASYACNLSCKGCTNYSDLNLKGNVAWSECKHWLEKWLDRVNINDFGIIGGEPLANPDINEWVTGARDLMPDAQIRLTTNGLLLHKKFDIVSQMHSIGNSVFKVSVHLDNHPVVENSIKEIFKQYKFEEVEEFGIKRYKSSNNFRFQINRPSSFIKTFKNNYSNMLPHQNNPADAFDICVQKTCPLLYKGNIYKCSSIGMLNDILKKFNRSEIADWQKYTQYAGISPSDSNLDIENFIKFFGKPESICSMCPSTKDTESIIDHTKHVKRKNEK